jgi:hypothetical protein
MKHVEMRLIQDTISAFLSQSLPIRRRDFSHELSCEAEKKQPLSNPAKKPCNPRWLLAALSSTLRGSQNYDRREFRHPLASVEAVSN